MLTGAAVAPAVLQQLHLWMEARALASGPSKKPDRVADLVSITGESGGQFFQQGSHGAAAGEPATARSPVQTRCRQRKGPGRRGGSARSVRPGSA